MLLCEEMRMLNMLGTINLLFSVEKYVRESQRMDETVIISECAVFSKCSKVVLSNSKTSSPKGKIAHPSQMCQGQISFQKTYKWAMETRGPKLNSSELLCLSWLPAILMLIRSKMNELAWRHHFPIISPWEIF